MAWFKINDRLCSHPVVPRVGDGALGYWMRLGCWLAQFPEQGDFIPEAVATHLLYRTPRRKLRALVDVGMLIPADGGYRMYDRLDVSISGVLDRAWVVETPGGSRRKIPAELRAAIYERDEYACLLCGSPDDLTLDHIYPWSKGGEDTLENLRTLCRPCNSSKGARV